MDTPSRPWDDDLRFSAALSAIRETTDEIQAASFAGLLRRIDRLQSLFVEGSRYWSELIAEDHVELTRLAAKLDALRERLLYSYFGATQLQSLRDVLYDLEEIIARNSKTEVVPDQNISPPQKQGILVR